MIGESLRQRRCAANKRYREKNKAKVSACKREWARKNRERVREIQRQSKWRKLGIPGPTRERPEFCECCGRFSDVALCNDHDHTTGKFRGWLCASCNRGIGYLGDSVANLERALAYLRRA